MEIRTKFVVRDKVYIKRYESSFEIKEIFINIYKTNKTNQIKTRIFYTFIGNPDLIEEKDCFATKEEAQKELEDDNESKI